MNDTFACSNCGGNMPAVPYERSVACPFCKKESPNLGCLRVGAEVMVAHDFFPDKYVVGRVVACAGPDAIDVATEDDGEAKTLRTKLEAVYPVVDARGLVSKGMAVYAKQPIGWARTYVVQVESDERITVQHTKFTSPAFYERVDPGLVRVPADPRLRVVRTRAQALQERLRNDPFGLMFDGIGYVVAAVFLSVVAFVVYTLFFD